MQLLQRSFSRRAQKCDHAVDQEKTELERTDPKVRGRTTTRPRGASDSTARTGHSRRHSMNERPLSAGGDRRKLQRNPQSARTTSGGPKKDLKVPKCSGDLERRGMTIEYRAGPDTFPFPTPSPHMSRSATPNPAHGEITALPSLSRAENSSGYPTPSQQLERPGKGITPRVAAQEAPHWGRLHASDAVFSRIAADSTRDQPRQGTVEQEQAGLGHSYPKRKKGPSWNAISNLFRSKAANDDSFTVKPIAATEPEPASFEAPPADFDPDTDPIAKAQTPLTCLFVPSPGIPASTVPGNELQNRSTSTQYQYPEKSHRTSLVPKRLGPRVKAHHAGASPRVWSPGIWRASQDAFRHSQQKDLDALVLNSIADQDTPRIDVNLPDVEFPRFSIMFEKQLPALTRSSLLDRRHSRLQGCQKQTDRGPAPGLQVDTGVGAIKQTIESKSAERHHSNLLRDGREGSVRRALIPQRPDVLERSSTAPANPLPANYRLPRKETHQSSSPESPISAFFSENSLPPTPTTVTTCTDGASFRRILDDSDHAWHAPPMIRTFSDPVDMKEIRVLVQPDDQAPCHQIEEPYPRVKSPEDLERQIVQVSVARQVSVSRARTRVMRAMEGTARPAAVPLRPRIVEFSKNRKSAAGVLDDASADYEAMPANATAHSRAASLACEEAQRKSIVSVKSARGTADDAPGQKADAV